MAKHKVSIPVPEELEQQLPADPQERQQVLIWGLREWRVNKALQAYKRGEGSLAYAARQAGISLREMIPLAYAHGLAPKIDSADLDLSEAQAALL
jgi:predicted HTH domain antitoxin